MSATPNNDNSCSIPTAGADMALPTATPTPTPPTSATLGDTDLQHLQHHGHLNQHLHGSGSSSSGGSCSGRMPSLSFLYGTGTAGKMTSSSTDDSDDVQDALTEELGNIRSVMHVTRENIDALTAKFSKLMEPPSMYIQEYDELTSKLHDLKLKEQKLEERVLEQQKLQQQQQLIQLEMMEEIVGDGVGDCHGDGNFNGVDDGAGDKGDVSGVGDEVVAAVEKLTLPKDGEEDAKACVLEGAKASLASDAEHFTNFATSMDKNMSTDEASSTNKHTFLKTLLGKSIYFCIYRTKD